MITTGPMYRTFDNALLCQHLAALPHIAVRLGGAPDDWEIAEVSDGNLNMVWIVRGPDGAVCVKQSLPHVRVDPSWKMPLDRTAFEAAYLRDVAPLVPDLTTALLDFDAERFVLVVEALTPHVVLRTALCARSATPGFGAAIGRFVGRSSVMTSLLNGPFEGMMQRIARFAANTTLTRITVDLVMTDPFCAHPRNRPMRPELTALEQELAADVALARAAAALRQRFLGTPQALLHGDLHTGSIMVHGQDVRVIDGEFAVCGPVGFDCGQFVANLAINAIADPGSDLALNEIVPFWAAFLAETERAWAEARGSDIHAGIHAGAGMADPATQAALRTAWCDGIYADMLGFAGLEIIRRTIGYAQVADYAAAPDRAEEAARRSRAIGLARRLLVQPAAFGDIGTLARAVADARGDAV